MTEEHNLYEHQPEHCRKPLPLKEFPDSLEPYLKRVLLVDPVDIYKRVYEKINPFNRYNWTIQFAELFPKPTDGKCACGCGNNLPVGKPMWFSKDCQMYAVCVWNVIGGRQEFVGYLFEKYFGNKLCFTCGENDWVDIDHIHPVSKGGGGCWLSNFQGLCKKCHKEKTRSDFNWTKLKTSE